MKTGTCQTRNHKNQFLKNLSNGSAQSNYKTVTSSRNSQVENIDNDYRFFIANPVIFIANPIIVNSPAIT